MENCFNKDSFAIFAQKYDLCSHTHTYNSRSLSKGLLFVPIYNSTNKTLKNYYSSILSWNYLQSILQYDSLNCSAKCLENLLAHYLISKYEKQ